MRGKLRFHLLLLLIVCSLPALIYYLYLFQYTSNYAPHSTIPNNNVRSYESRIAALEQELDDNRLLTQQIREQISQYLNDLSQNHRSQPGRPSPLECKIDALGQNLNVDQTIESALDKMAFDNPNGGVWTQGWPINVNESRFNQQNPLQVIVVPHSHNDPGWLKTFEQYFATQTKRILDNVLSQLTRHSQRTFIWAEVSYFAMWYESLKSEDAKESVKMLLEKGQLEFVTGGWVMNDEANTDYFAIIAQMVEGHEWLTHHLNYRPKHGWAIDPFGVSPTMAFLLKRMGLRAMVVQRVHYAMKRYLAQRTMLEFQWRQSWEDKAMLDQAGDILCHVMPFYSYDVPHTCGPDPKVCCQFDFKRLHNPRLACPWKVSPQMITPNNVRSRANLLLDQYKKKSMLYRTNVLMVPLGDDFRFDKSIEWINQFENYQRLFDHINNDTTYHTKIKFGTLNDYFDLIGQNHSLFPSVSGDFFTYADRDDNYWSGYYTSRPFYKRYDRIFESYLRAAEILFAANSIANGGRNNLLQQLGPLLSTARRSLALFQHHDGITGTARDTVVHDYAVKMFTGITNCQHIIAAITNSMFYLPMDNYPSLSVNFTHHVHIDRPETETFFELDAKLSKRWSLLIYNSLVRERYEAICVRLRIIDYKRRNWILRDLHGKLITEVQINALDSNSSSNHTEEEACFMGTLAALSITQFTVELSDFDPHYEQSKQTWIRNFSDTKINANDEFEIESDRIRLSFGRNDGLLRHVTRFDNGGHEIERFKLRIDFVTYGTRIKKNTDHSGAYLFIPDEDEPQDLPYRDVRVLVIKGSLVSRVHIHLDGPLPIEHVLCVVQGEPWFNVRNLFHLKRGRFSNKELLMRLYSDVANDGLFYSDLNGLQITRRQYREKIPLQGNVYPMPSMAYLQDRRYRLTIVTAQPLGVTSHFSGNLDIFLDRLLLKDDQRGLGQGVTDNVLTQEWFRILVEPTSQDVFKPSLEAQTALLLMLHPPFQMHSNQQSNQGQLKFVRNELPCDLHVLNLRANLFASDEFHLFLHRFASTCESRCIESKVTLNDLLHPILRDLLDDRGTRRSLSLMHSKGDWNLTTDSIQVSSNDFEVITLRLKN